MIRKQRLCRICRERPVWSRGDVKDPGAVCKRCHHKHVWPTRKATTPDEPMGPSAEPLTDEDDIPCPGPPPP